MIQEPPKNLNVEMHCHEEEEDEMQSCTSIANCRSVREAAKAAADEAYDSCHETTIEGKEEF